MAMASLDLSVGVSDTSTMVTMKHSARKLIVHVTESYKSAHAITVKEMPSVLGFHFCLRAVGSAPCRVSVLFVDQLAKQILPFFL